jgi:O-antigen/teichoic acid export membrane protein
VTVTTAALRTRAVRRAFVSGAGAKVLTVLAGLASVAIAVRALGAPGYGVVATLAGIVGALGFLDLGIGNAAIGRFAAAHARADDHGLRQETGRVLVFLTLVAAAGIVVFVPVVLLLPMGELIAHSGVPEGELTASAVVFVVVTCIAIPASIGSRLALGLQRGAQNNVVAVVAAIGVVAAVAVGAAVHAPLIAFVTVFLGIPVLANAVQSFALLRPRGLGGALELRGMRLQPLFELVPGAIPFAGLALAGAVAYQTDALVVAAVVGAAGAAAYALPARLFNGLSVLFSGGLQQVWASTAHALAEGDLAWVRRTFRRTFTITMALFAVAALAVVGVGPWFIGIWSGGAVEVGPGPLAAFALWGLYGFAMSQCSMLLNGAGRVRTQAITAIVMAVANLPVSIVLTQQLGIVGPVLGSLITHALIVGVPTAVMTRRLLRGAYSTGRAAA